MVLNSYSFNYLQDFTSPKIFPDFFPSSLDSTKNKFPQFVFSPKEQLCQSRQPRSVWSHENHSFEKNALGSKPGSKQRNSAQIYQNHQVNIEICSFQIPYEILVDEWRDSYCGWMKSGKPVEFGSLFPFFAGFYTSKRWCRIHQHHQQYTSSSSLGRMPCPGTTSQHGVSVMHPNQPTHWVNRWIYLNH